MCYTQPVLFKFKVRVSLMENPLESWCLQTFNPYNIKYLIDIYFKININISETLIILSLELIMLNI